MADQKPKAQRPVQRNWLHYFGKVAAAVVPRLIPGTELLFAPLTAAEILRQERVTARAQRVEESARALTLRSAARTWSRPEVRRVLEGRREAAETGRPIQAAPTVTAHREKVFTVLRRASLLSRQHALAREAPARYARLIHQRARRRFELRKAA